MPPQVSPRLIELPWRGALPLASGSDEEEAMRHSLVVAVEPGEFDRPVLNLRISVRAWESWRGD